jgi:NMD protein affecting ribosome stability and mRNA decay
MSGCYRCGLSDGSEERLCETCFARRFQCGKLTLEPFSATPATGIEMSPRIQRWVISSGAVLYIGLVSLGISVQTQRIDARQASAESEYVRVGGNEYPVRYEHEFGYIAGPRASSPTD